VKPEPAPTPDESGGHPPAMKLFVQRCFSEVSEQKGNAEVLKVCDT